MYHGIALLKMFAPCKTVRAAISTITMYAKIHFLFASPKGYLPKIQEVLHRLAAATPSEATMVY
jgi:hypothetical protein